MKVTKRPQTVGDGRTPVKTSKSGDVATPKVRIDASNRDRITTAGQALAEILLPAKAEVEALHELPKLPLTPPSVDELPKAQGILQGLWGRVLDMVSGSTATRETNRARKLVSEVNKHTETVAKMSDSELRAQTDHFKAEITTATKGKTDALAAAEQKLATAKPEDRPDLRLDVRAARRALAKAEQRALDNILPEAYATVREAGKRSTGMSHYNVQLMAGALMSKNMVAEMYTGEGKTLAATLPAYLSALTGHGFHVVTVNDYLAKRDAEEMSDIYRYLGMSVGVLQNNGQQSIIDGYKDGEAPDAKTPRSVTRKEAYGADITYGTASEFAFDYLRDNGVKDPSQRVQRPLWGVLLDEVDSLLIDEARTPHIIAGVGEAPDGEDLAKFRDLVASLDWETDVEWDLEEHWVSLTTEGLEKIEAQLDIDNLYDSPNINDLYHVDNALRARFLLRKDEHYTIIDGEVRTVGHSGHAMAGRRFTRGLHQALESKEGLEVRPENVTAASVTMRDFLSQYQKVAGMTGTAVSAKSVFRDVYGLDVARVPTRKPLIRVDHPDRVFKGPEDKLMAFLDHVAEVHATGRPILVGVEWTSTAEALGELLKKSKGIDVQVLGAKSSAEEADIIANAGRVGSVTVATTRGGRGVDVKLGGNKKVVAKQLEEQEGLQPDEAMAQAAEITGLERAEVLGLGGLFVMSYEHLDSRRRDDQLRGRAGRQGDPGATVVYSSLEDALFDGVEAAEDLSKAEGELDAVAARNLTERALDRSENKVNDALTQSLPYDRVADQHRTRFYDVRADVIEVSDSRPIVQNAIDYVIEDYFDAAGASNAKKKLKPEVAKVLYDSLHELLPLPPGAPPPKWTESPAGEIRKDINKLVDALLAKRDGAVGEEFARLLERDALITSLDESWSAYLDDINDLRQGIGYRAYGQKDPKLEFVLEASKLFDDMMVDARIRMAAKLLKRMPKLPSMPTPEAKEAARAEVQAEVEAPTFKRQLRDAPVESGSEAATPTHKPLGKRRRRIHRQATAQQHYVPGGIKPHRELKPEDD